ncbi:putative sh3 domain-containing protein [Erysiphe necator]|uniref:Putative sh3 domain-containing protein n=1 Tax=Uncinula necator TaxID=52586 RepID=A0A0B1PAJ7_UNCNE|nr:putative sh3 domain-containing protein [Erysiphe necator]
MSASLVSEERQRIINNNRSLRTIKNELESLAERGAISDDVYDTIMSALPAESPLNSNSARGNITKNNVVVDPSPSPADPPSLAMGNLCLNNEPTPSPASVPLTAPTKVEIARANALYRYAEAGDCNFEVGDTIIVYEYMNQDWWLGKNLRTGQEGVFPQNYVQRLPHPAQGPYMNEKGGIYQNGFPPPYQQQMQPSAPPPSGPINPYNSSVPPMQIAEQPSESKMGKGGEMGKKFGKKLGNAAIFGAGATIGGNIVNSIF